MRPKLFGLIAPDALDSQATPLAHGPFDVIVGVVGPERPWRAGGIDQFEAQGAPGRGRDAGDGERIGQRPGTDPGHMVQTGGVGARSPHRRPDVEPVGPVLHQAGGPEGLLDAELWGIVLVSPAGQAYGAGLVGLALALAARRGVAVAGALLMLAPAFLGAGRDAEVMKEQLSAADQAIQALARSAKASQMSLADMQKAYGNSADEV